MKRFVSSLLVIAFLFLTTGCATTARKSILPEQRAQIGSTKLILEIPQEEVFVTFNANSSASMTGAIVGGPIGALIGGVIDASIIAERQKNMIAQIQPLRTALKYYNFSDEYGSSLEKAIKPIEWIKSESYQVQNLKKSQLNKLIINMEENSLFDINTKYYLSDDYKKMIIEATAGMYKKDIAIEESKKPVRDQETPGQISSTSKRDASLGMIFWTTLAYQSSEIEAVDNNDAVKKWAANNGEKFKKAVMEGAEEIAKLLAYDLLNPVDIIIPEKEPEMVTSNEIPSHNNGERGPNEVSTKPIKQKMTLIKENLGRKIVRLNNGMLISLPNDDLVISKFYSSMSY